MSDTTDGQGDDPTRPHPADPDAVALLASAYLDGEATDDERRLVESDPELLDEVESLRQVRAVLGATTEPPPISVREAHLAAALDVWDRMSDLERSGDVTPGGGTDAAAAAAAAAITTPPPTTLPRRDRRDGAGGSRWFLGAAAGFIVLAGGGLLIRGLTDSGSDDGDLASDLPAAEESLDEAATEPEILAAEASDAFEGVESEPVPPSIEDDVAFDEDLRSADDGGDAAADGDESADAAMVEEEPAEEPADEAMEESVEESEAADDVAAGGEFDAFPPEVDLPRLATIEELEDFAALAYYAPVDAEAPEVELEQPYPTCDDELAPFFSIDQYVGPAIYVPGDEAFQTDEQVVVAVEDGDPATVVAYRPTDCTVVAQTPMPSQAEFEERRDRP